MHLPTGQKAAGERTDGAIPGVRLSPVDLRNLALIDDPALAGMQRGDVSGCASAGTPLEASPVCIEEDPTVLGRVVGDEVLIGPEITSIKTGQDGPLAHVRVTVSPDNPHFSTDGFAIYTKDGSTLVCMVVPCESYRVMAGCRRIGARAFDGAEKLCAVELPCGLESIGRLAFAKSGISSIRLPDSVKVVDEKAFYGCKELVSCRMGQGVQEVGALAFALSALERIALPASVHSLSRDAFDGTPVMRAAHAGAIQVSADNERYILDAEGGLYEEGRFAGLLSCVAEYTVAAGCAEVLPQACCRNLYLRAVTLPIGLVSVGDDAFRGCKNLQHVDIPETLIRIGAHAFMDTALRSLRLPAALDDLGEGAFLVGGENPARMRRPLQHVEVDARNGRFYLESGLLCERGAGDGGADKVLLYVGPEARVTIPDAVNRIAPYAFMGAQGVEHLIMHGHMHSICQGALSVARSIPQVTVEVDGVWRTLPIPSLSPRFRTYTDLFTTEDGRTVFVFPYYDAWVTNACGVHEFAPAAVARLRDPVWMDEEVRELYRGILRRKQATVCACFADAGDLEALEDIRSWGVLEDAAVEEALKMAVQEGEGQAVGCLLELKRRAGAGTGLDLSI